MIPVIPAIFIGICVIDITQRMVSSRKQQKYLNELLDLETARNLMIEGLRDDLEKEEAIKKRIKDLCAERPELTKELLS